MVFGTESTLGYRPKPEPRSEACEGLDMLEEVNGQHFVMHHQQCYSLFTNKVGLERAEKRREKAVIQAETFDEPPAKKRATRKRRCWLRCVVVRHDA